MYKRFSFGYYYILVKFELDVLVRITAELVDVEGNENAREEANSLEDLSEAMRQLQCGHAC